MFARLLGVFAAEGYADLVGWGGAGVVIGMLGLVFRGLTTQARGTNTLVSQLQEERTSAVEWREFYRADRDYWMRRALGDTQLPERPVPPERPPYNADELEPTDEL